MTSPFPEDPAEFAGHPVQRFKGTAAYDGTNLYGWQAQPGGNTVQDFIEARLQSIFKQPVRIHGSGRTDSGVHARGQVFHFDAPWPHPVAHLHQALRSGLPASIGIERLQIAHPGFHARSSATGKRYIYRIFEGYANPLESRYCYSTGRRRLDTDSMATAAQSLLGKHDFSAFCADRGDGSEENPVKDLRVLAVTRRGRRITIRTEASGYLYKMVRSLVGALIDVGTGKLAPGDLVNIRESRTRTAKVVTAPASGLTLDRVFYT